MPGVSRTVRRRTSLAASAIVVIAVLGALPASAQSSSPSAETSPGPAAESFGNQVVLLGRVVVPQGQSVGEVIVFSGRVVVEGIVRGDVVVVNGPITVSGQVSGSVVALGGSVRLSGTAQVGGDVLAHGRVIVAPGAAVQGRMTEGVSFNVGRPLRAVAAFVSWLAVAVSTLLLGLIFAFVAPRALDGAGDAGRTAPWASAGWGVALALGIPALALLAVVLVLGIPIGIGLLLSLVLLSLIGVVVTAQALGRALVDLERRPTTAFLAGWAIETVIGVIPYVSGAVFAAAAIFGLGAMAVAVWRSRGPRLSARAAGKHRAGAVAVDPTGSREAPGL
ncbi:MAG: polymer-forming cytoskeletal protein [Actinomycetota bacterium]